MKPIIDLTENVYFRLAADAYAATAEWVAVTDWATEGPWLIGVSCAVLVYFLPLIIAVVRRHPQSGWIAMLNVFGGPTVVGWLVALGWAFTP
jgi:hypothetical protein